MASEPAVSTSRDGAVALLRLNRPERMNTIDDALAQALLAGLREAAADPAVRVVLLAGEGRAFMAGADLAVFADDMPAAPQTAARLIECVHEGLRLIRTMPKPVVVAVQ